MTDDRLDRATLSLDGLSIGDAFGQQFFYPNVLETADRQNPPSPPWNYTDDTEMALGILEVLREFGEINQDALATTFAKRYASNPHRGYGAGAIDLLTSVQRGGNWRRESENMFGGSGSYGNGAAMRVAVLGAWFADDVNQTIEQAVRSAEVTHSHREGIAGAIAVALAAGWVWRRRNSVKAESSREMIKWVIPYLEQTEVRRRLEWVAQRPLDDWAFDIAAHVGCGEQISAQDTVPLCLWLAAANLDEFTESLWTTVRIGGDIDTNCAIVGGIVALNVGRKGIPDDWKRWREPLS